MRMIGIMSGKGGVGKTTLSINLGAILAKQFKKNVTLVDCNVTTSHLGLYLGIYYSPITLNKVLRGEYHIDEAVFNHYTGMKVIPASLSTSELEGVDVFYLKDKLQNLLKSNDFVFLDAAPGLGREAIASLRASREIIYVTSPYVPSVMDIVRTNEVAQEAGAKPLGIVLNMTHNDRHEMTKEEVEQLTGLQVLGNIPYDRLIKRSLTLKMPSVALDPRARSSREFIKIAEKITGEKSPESKESFTEYLQRMVKFADLSRLRTKASAQAVKGEVQ